MKTKERLLCCGCYVTWFYNFKCRWCGHDYSKLIDPFTEEPTP